MIMDEIHFRYHSLYQKDGIKERVKMNGDKEALLQKDKNLSSQIGKIHL